jgi:DNA-binding response OmpR family regulator
MKILVVEDDPLFCKMIDKVLNNHGFEVHTLANGDEADRKLREESFDLLITDILMPGKEGIELIADIKDTRPDMKILAMSAGGMVGRSSYLELAEASGADSVIDKPFTPDELLEKIEKISAS